MGYLYKGLCYPTLPTAKAADCSDSSVFWGSGTTLYAAKCTSTDFTLGSKTLCVQANGGTCTNRTITYPTYPTCDYDGGAAMSSDYFAALLSFLVIIFVASKLKNYFWKPHESI